MLNSQRQHFDGLFAHDDDPWGYRTLFSERRRHQLVLAMLPRERYVNAFEPGCANGVLSRLLADRCDRLLASDASAVAVERAAATLVHCASVTVDQRTLPQEWPHGSFDLIVLVDFLYYLEPAEVSTVVRLAERSLSSDGTLIVAHWRGSASDFLTPTDDVHRIVKTAMNRPPSIHLDDPGHALDMWVASGGPQ